MEDIYVIQGEKHRPMFILKKVVDLIGADYRTINMIVKNWDETYHREQCGVLREDRVSEYNDFESPLLSYEALVRLGDEVELYEYQQPLLVDILDRAKGVESKHNPLSSTGVDLTFLLG